VSILYTALTAMMTGFVIGGAARFAVPGPDPMPFWLTVLIGLVGSAIGTAIGALLFGAQHTFDSSGRSLRMARNALRTAAWFGRGFRSLWASRLADLLELLALLAVLPLALWAAGIVERAMALFA